MVVSQGELDTVMLDLVPVAVNQLQFLGPCFSNFCGRSNHTEDRCWTKHGQPMPAWANTIIDSTPSRTQGDTSTANLIAEVERLLLERTGYVTTLVTRSAHPHSNQNPAFF